MSISSVLFSEDMVHPIEPDETRPSDSTLTHRLGGDRWAFLEDIDAPQWVDLDVEIFKPDVERDDPWFHQSHWHIEMPLADFMASPERSPEKQSVESYESGPQGTTNDENLSSPTASGEDDIQSGLRDATQLFGSNLFPTEERQQEINSNFRPRKTWQHKATMGPKGGNHHGLEGQKDVLPTGNRHPGMFKPYSRVIPTESQQSKGPWARLTAKIKPEDTYVRESKKVVGHTDIINTASGRGKRDVSLLSKNVFSRLARASKEGQISSGKDKLSTKETVVPETNFSEQEKPALTVANQKLYVDQWKQKAHKLNAEKIKVSAKVDRLQVNIEKESNVVSKNSGMSRWLSKASNDRKELVQVTEIDLKKNADIGLKKKTDMASASHSEEKLGRPWRNTSAMEKVKPPSSGFMKALNRQRQETSGGEAERLNQGEAGRSRPSQSLFDTKGREGGSVESSTKLDISPMKASVGVVKKASNASLTNGKVSHLLGVETRNKGIQLILQKVGSGSVLETNEVKLESKKSTTVKANSQKPTDSCSRWTQKLGRLKDAVEMVSGMYKSTSGKKMSLKGDLDHKIGNLEKSKFQDSSEGKGKSASSVCSQPEETGNDETGSPGVQKTASTLANTQKKDITIVSSGKNARQKIGPQVTEFSAAENSNRRKTDALKKQQWRFVGPYLRPSKCVQKDSSNLLKTSCAMLSSVEGGVSTKKLTHKGRDDVSECSSRQTRQPGFKDVKEWEAISGRCYNDLSLHQRNQADADIAAINRSQALVTGPES